MKLTTISYLDFLARLPQAGQRIHGYQTDQHIVVYQAYNHQIADYAAEHHTLGGPHYSYNRMSWIKPNFLWMMYRCGWADKENQERVLAITVNKTDFENILREAVFSSYNANYYKSHDEWKNALEQKDVRLQWDPDHDPFGKKLSRRAIQVGMKGRTLESFGKSQIKSIEDITHFVKEQKAYVDQAQLSKLQVPIETVFTLSDDTLKKQIGIDH